MFCFAVSQAGDGKKEDILTVGNFKPRLPSSPVSWNVVIHRLWQQKAFAAIAFITSGLPGPPASILENAAVPHECHCDGMDIQRVCEMLGVLVCM